MTQQPDYIRYLESATRSEFAERLRDEGYSVEPAQTYGDVQFDLVARKGNKQVAYEFKAGKSPKHNREGLERLQRAARDAGLEFHIVVVNPPPRVKVEVENLASQLQGHLVRFLPQELTQLPYRTTIAAVYDLKITDIYVGDGKVRLAGLATVEVNLHEPDDARDSDSSGDAFPFRFKAVVSADGQLKAVEELIVDTSTFYE